MRVALLGTTLDIPNVPLPPDPTTVPEFAKLKSLIEDEFYMHFDVRISIDNWEYIFMRASAYRIL